jgi:rare lipoprotein A
MMSRLPVLVLLGLLAGCSTTPPPLDDSADGPPTGGIEPSRIPDAVPKPEPRSRYGNPAQYTVLGQTYQTLESSRGYRERGVASWYGRRFHGRLTSNREPYDMYAMTAAHRSLPLPTYARVTHLGNGRSVVVRINDRGPFHDNRIIDLSYAAAAKLGMLGAGTAPVEIAAIDPLRPTPPPVLATTTQQPRYFLQVGAFGDPGNARRLHRRLSDSLSQTISITPHGRPGNPIYRVRIGPLASVEQVDNLSIELHRMGVEHARVVLD